MLKVIVLGLLGLTVAAMIWVRLAPTDVAAWHTANLDAKPPGEYPGARSHVSQRSVQGDGRDLLARLDRIIRSTPRTAIVAGSLDEGQVTYVTRSRVMGYPDFTTVTLTQLADSDMSTLQVYGRARFGQSDLGVNTARVTGWMAQLDGMDGTDTPTQ